MDKATKKNLTTELAYLSTELDRATTEEEYERVLSKIERIENLLYQSRIDKEKLLSIASSLLSVILVLNYERLGVITSKAFRLPKISK